MEYYVTPTGAGVAGGAGGVLDYALSAHASQTFSIAHCTDSEDLPPNPTAIPNLYAAFRNSAFDCTPMSNNNLYTLHGNMMLMNEKHA